MVADLLVVASARALALQHELADKGLLDLEAVAARMRRMQERADEAIELGPQYETFRRWRRERQGDEEPPDDRT